MKAYGNRNSKNIIIQPSDEHDLSLMESEAEEIKRLIKNDDFLLLAYPVNDWNRELSPWKAPAVFGKEDFSDGADDTLQKIISELGEIDSEKKYFLAGYSLAGLFSLWASFNTDIFSGIVAASPSMWFPNFVDFTKENKIQTPKVYLSLGKKEEKTKNPVMSRVGDCIREEYEILKDNGVKTILEWNEGNHFVDSDKRLAKGIAWILCRFHIN